MNLLDKIELGIIFIIIIGAFTGMILLGKLEPPEPHKSPFQKGLDYAKENPQYKCDALLCKGWQEDCPNVKLVCASCYT